jgi:hypothetical protein
MSMEYYSAMAQYHQSRAERFAANENSVIRHVECRTTDQIYVYLYEDGVHIQTQHVDVPATWWDRWPSDATVRRHVHKHADIGSARITTLDA